MENYFNYGKIKQYLKKPAVRTAIALSAWLLIFLFVFWLIRLFSIPSYYRTFKSVSDGQVSLYLTNYILPELHNKSQYGRPFDLVISQDGINDIITRHIDANSLQQSGFSDLSVTFKKGRMLLTGKTSYWGFDFVTTAVLRPYIDKKGYFRPGVSKILAGKSGLPFADEIVKRKILYKLASISDDSNIAGVVGILFGGDKTEPVFTLNHTKLRIEKITVRKREITINFIPQ
ncbi:MAG: hypothetical protein KKE31_00450 [Planctomycetes bacterium]|nr:hypothetical protein [Planctomycetota bacterium]MBU1518244.1 hypothetical protein [Planctomycetota bacterium]MBU2457093.1 hypothetical protein [Planctomycetota bacterium]